jgi:hypothetical protein
MKVTKEQLKKIIKEEIDALQEQEGSFLQISISDDGYDKDIEQISNPDDVDVDVSENPYVAYRAVVKVVKSSGEL